MSEADTLKRILKRERLARKQAEDILEKKSRELFYANEELKSLNSDLEQKVLERTEQIQQAMEEARAATVAKSDFLSKMSHEIRTPLNAIIGLTDLMVRDVDDVQGLTYAKAIQSAGNNLLNIINEILDFSKIESGKMEFESIPFDLDKVLNDLIGTFKFKAQEKGLQLNLVVGEAWPKSIQGDPGKLTQILINLVGNAFKFTERGGISIQASQTHQKGQKIRIHFCVRDSGIGIPADKQALVFESFSQAESGTSRKFGGTGLGLAIVKQLVELQGGRIWLESKSGVGSTFHFELPFIHVPSVDQTTSERKILDENLADLKVLLAEDTPINQFLMRQLFTRRSVQFVIANNGLEALHHLGSSDFDLVLMDLHMPEMDGLQAIHHIRSGKTQVLNKQIPIYALTADAFVDTKEKLMKAGVDGYLSKPVNVEELYSLLGRYARSIRQRKGGQQGQ
ncbi:ATP-binding protein [Pontibacter sp. G13]|uniref:ATP-binding protein n=1 Tax=Pontibacter sp. G13 TaxID=3074898 RepID=UPI002889318E|nr:ATP-binding protein [Pontibacter sp. G13]WNJ20686.1 ATP-binding protein [Pontibacter sp. G13]